MEDEVQKYNILIAEDQQLQRLALMDLLEGLENYNVKDAVNGLVAKKILLESGIQFDLVLLDYNMPELDGLEVLMWMKNQEEFKDIPVVMMSTEEETQRLYYCIDKGAVNYLVKPIRRQAIKSLSKYIKKKDTTAKQMLKNAKGGDYERIKLLGRGGMATVQLVQDKSDGELYAMKIIHMFHYDEQKQQTVNNEITLLSILDSPFTLRYHEHFMKNQNMYICMEYAPGGVISDKIKECKKLGKIIPDSKVKDWLTQSVLALMYIHSKNIMHRDIKPENMFLTNEEILKLGDFGVSREVDVNIDLAKTTCGTPYYMPPEVCSGQRYGHQADIWALGCSFYEIMTMHLPFDSETLAGLFEVIKNEEPSRPLPSIYDPGLIKIVNKMISKNPTERPSITDLLEVPFIQERIKKWCTEDQTVKEFVEEHITLNLKIAQNNRAEQTSKKNLKLTDDQMNLEALKNAPELIVVQLMKQVELRTIKNGMFSKFNDACEAKDLLQALQKIELNSTLAAAHKEILNLLIEKGILIVLKGDEEEFDKNGVYTFVYSKGGNPINTVGEFADFFNLKIFEFEESEVSDNIKLSKDIIDICIQLQEDLSEKGLEDLKYDPKNVYTIPNFLLLIQELCKLQVADPGALNKNQRVAFFLNSYQAIMTYKKLFEGAKGKQQASGGLLSYVGLGKTTASPEFKIGKYNYTIDDIIHGVLRGNKKKPGSWGKQFKASDYRSNILDVIC